MTTHAANHSKIFGCAIHGSIRVSAMALKIIDTPEFQRLKSISQLGLVPGVFPGRHSRFEHSLGVYHLTSRVLEKIKQMYPHRLYHIRELNPDFDIELTPKIIECIKIAGLCHDVGHGPYSHLFDHLMSEVAPDNPNREHEARSCLIMELLCRRELGSELDDKHIQFMKSIIAPSQTYHTGALYQIVCNTLNDIDVDKFDYLQRDTNAIRFHIIPDFERLLSQFMIDINGNIAYPKHSVEHINHMFNTRYSMHRSVYNHKTVKILECMYMDLFREVDPVLKLSSSINDMTEFCKLTDTSILDAICLMHNPPPFIKIALSPEDLKRIGRAHQILENIKYRKLYKHIVDLPDDADHTKEQALKSRVAAIIEANSDLSPDDFETVRVQYGRVGHGRPNPFKTIYFYDKFENNQTFTLFDTYKPAQCDVREHRVLLVCKRLEICPRISVAIKSI